jgi:hypothetical protein
MKEKISGYNFSDWLRIIKGIDDDCWFNMSGNQRENLRKEYMENRNNV